VRVNDLVLGALQAEPNLDFESRAIYLWISALQPVSVRTLALHVGVRWHSVAQACERLVAAGWLRLERSQRGTRPLPLVPLRVQTRLAELFEAAYEMADKRGEFLMKRQLDLIVNSDCYVDNARAKFLTNPDGGQALEYDRYYPDFEVAFEFNGQQHYIALPAFGDEELQHKTRARDAVKAGLSTWAGVELVVITAEQLRPVVFRSLLPARLPLRYVDEAGPYFKALARISEAYADRALREAAKAGRAGKI